jgi:uncharacterized coiled-coil DUF342 family protein
LSEDKLRVDEPLISTDVDSLIRMLADKKRISLSELRQISRIDKKTLDKWIAVLEDEDYITVEYGIRGTNIIWKDSPLSAAAAKPLDVGEEPFGPAEPEPAQEQEEGPIKLSPEDEEIISSDVVATDDSEPIHADTKELNDEFSAVKPLDDEPEPEELLSEYLARRRGADEDEDSIKSGILTNMKEEKQDEVDTSIVSDKNEKKAPRHAPRQFDEPDDESGSEEDEDQEEDEEEISTGKDRSTVRERPLETLIPTSRSRPPTADVRELMSSYMDEINKEKAKIAELTKEKEALYRDSLIPMEGKMQADIVAFTEKIIEKQSKIAELKEHVLELPDKVDELGRLQQQMENLKNEGRDALQRTREKADEFVTDLNDSKAEIEGKLSQAGSSLEAQSNRVKELERVSASLDARSDKLKAMLDAAKTQADEITSAISSLDSDISQVEKAKADVQQTTGSIKASVAQHGSELGSLQQELDGIEKMEHWVQEYIRDYETKISDIESYVERSEDEMIELREAAESLYLRKYLGELESMTEDYQNGLQRRPSRSGSARPRTASPGSSKRARS